MMINNQTTALTVQRKIASVSSRQKILMYSSSVVVFFFVCVHLLFPPCVLSSCHSAEGSALLLHVNRVSSWSFTVAPYYVMPHTPAGTRAFKWLLSACQDAARSHVHHFALHSYAATTDR